MNAISVKEIYMTGPVNISIRMDNLIGKAPSQLKGKADLDSSMKELSDDQIMETIYSEYSNYIYTIIKNKCRYFKLNDADIEDCFIDVIIKMCERGCRKVRQFKGESSFKTFLTVQCRNLAIDFIRKEIKNRERFKLVDNISDDWNEICTIYDNNSLRENPERLYLSKERESIIEKVHVIIEKEIENLPDQDRVMTRLRLKKNMSYREIDEFLDIDNSRYRLSKVFQSIRSNIDNDIKNLLEDIFTEDQYVKNG